MRLLLRLCLIPASALFLSTLAAPARACHPPSCDPVVVAPGDGSSVPANLPGFPVLDEVASAHSDAGVPETKLELVDPAGKPVPLTRGALAGGGGLYAPGAPLVPGGQYQLRFVSTCNLAVFGPRPAPNVVRRVMVGPAQSLPTTAGTVTASTALVPKFSVPVGSGSCSEEHEVAMARVTLQPSAQLAPFLPLARLTMKVDGHLWAQGVWGGGVRHPPNPYYMPEPEALEIFTVCANGKPLWGIGDGDHKGELTVEVPGAPALPPIPFSFRLACSATAAPAPTDGGDSDATDGQPAIDAADGGASEGSTPKPKPRIDLGDDVGDGSASCQMGAGRVSSGTLALAFLGLLIVRSARRRRRSAP